VSDSIWKKELSFKRKPKEESSVDVAADEPVDDEPKQSLLKKEISFRRKPKAEKAPKPEKAPKAERQSFLKKEISFSRKPKDDLEWEAPKAEKQSFLKKEISFSRKPNVDREIERLAHEAAQAVAADTATFEVGQPTELAEAFVAAMPDPEPVVEQSVEVAPVLEAAPVLEPAPEFVFPEAVDPASPVELPYDVVAPVEAPAVAEWLPAEPVAEVVEPWLAEPELPPAPVAVEPVVEVHPPVPASELPVLDEPVVKVPFWKKDVSLSRKPKAPKTPKAAKPPKVKTDATGPFWKKELSLGRKKTAADPEAFELPKTKGAPFWKRELALPKLGRPSIPSLSKEGKQEKQGKHKAQRLVGLKIGSSQLAAARVSNNGVVELQQIARAPLAAGIVVGGELRDPEALGDALKAFFAKHKLPKKGVRLGIASNRIGVRIIDIVGVAEEKQLANAVQFRAQEALPIPLDEAVLDYRLLDESVDAEGETHKRVLLVVAYRELIERYDSACRKAGIALAGIDLEAFALLRALGAPADREGSALVAIAIGHDRSTFAVSDGRICEFTRVVEWGGSSLNVALARAFDSTPSEVEALKKSLSLETNWVSEDLSAEESAIALDSVRRQVQSFSRELVSSLQFYQNQPGSLGIGEIVITGGTAELPGLAEEIERLIGVRVRIGNPLARLKVAKRVSAGDHVGSLAVAIGLGIED
jgi:type IV pilus assembly protein PilM